MTISFDDDRVTRHNNRPFRVKLRLSVFRIVSCCVFSRHKTLAVTNCETVLLDSVKLSGGSEAAQQSPQLCRDSCATLLLLCGVMEHNIVVINTDRTGALLLPDCRSAACLPPPQPDLRHSGRDVRPGGGRPARPAPPGPPRPTPARPCRPLLGVVICGDT